jgi:hypothetical protein
MPPLTITNEAGNRLDGSALLSPKNVKYSAYGGSFLPILKTVRATWREGGYRYQGQGVWAGGTIIGDYTVPVRTPCHFR